MILCLKRMQKMRCSLDCQDAFRLRFLEMREFFLSSLFRRGPL
jgi:hypothetical protein